MHPKEKKSHGEEGCVNVLSIWVKAKQIMQIDRCFPYIQYMGTFFRFHPDVWNHVDIIITSL